MINELRRLMTEECIDFFVVTMNDEHLSEYTSQSDRYIAALTGFNGSAGTLVVSQEEALLFTDSRYHVQAANELDGTEVSLMKQGLPDVPSPEEYLSGHIWEGQKIAIDLRTLSYERYRSLVGKLPSSIEVCDGAGVLKRAVLGLPNREFGDICQVPDEYAGRSTADKIGSLRKRIRKHYVTEDSYTYIVSDLPSVMWLMNIRGCDISHVPVAYSYAVVTPFTATLYARKDKLPGALSDMLSDAGVMIREYSCFYQDIEDIATDVLVADPFANNAKILEKADREGMLTECSDPVLIPKAYKNDSEIKGIKNAHIKDAITMIRFIRMIKEAAKEGTLPDEYELGMTLDDMRIKGGSEGPSFSTICAYSDNSAIVHYVAEKDSAKMLRPEGFLLVDSGGQYRFEGTTDITRTIALGDLSDEEKKVYTTVLKGNLRLMDTVFPQGFKGAFLDGIAEEPLWSAGFFCGHGIGHGVGCYLSVHESEARISRNEGKREVALLPGVVVSDEPGIYIEGKFGVRLENLLLVERAPDTDGHRMCRFSPLSLVPFDSDAIKTDMLSDRELEILRKYNRMILDRIGPELDEETLLWLKENIDIK